MRNNYSAISFLMAVFFALKNNIESVMIYKRFQTIKWHKIKHRFGCLGVRTQKYQVRKVWNDE